MEKLPLTQNRAAQNCRLLWVDDQIEQLGTFVQALEREGFEVFTASSTASAVTLATTKSFDICLVDIQMPPPDGIECLRQLHRLNPSCQLATLSSYHYLDKYKKQLRALDFKVQLMDKDFPDALAIDFRDQFIEPIRRLVVEGVTLTISDQDKMARDVNLGHPFEMPLVDFTKLPLVVKDKLRLQAGQIASRTVAKAFSEGKIWVMLCGNPEVIRASASSPDEILSDRDVMEFSKSQQRPVYHFWREVQCEDMWTPCCCGGGQSYYPTVTVEFGQQQIKVHFDTGSPMTFFSYEELVSLAVIPPTQDFGSALRKGFPKEYWAARLEVTAILRCQRSGETQEVTIRGQAVRDWEASPYTKQCTSHCETYGYHTRDPHLCPERKALVGRNLLLENALVLVLDGKSKQTRLGD